MPLARAARLADHAASFCVFVAENGFISQLAAKQLGSIPESLFPLLACRSRLSLSGLDIAVACAIFFAGQILFSQLFFWLGLRDRPY